MRKFNFLCLFIFFSFANLAYSAPEMWMLVSAKATYDREMFPEDFERSFTNPEEWDESLRYMDAYFFSNSAGGHSFLTTEFYRINVVPLFEKHNISINFDTGFATWLSCRNNPDYAIQLDLERIQKIHDAGGKVKYISLQSVLGKAVPDHLKANCPTYTLDQRIADVIFYMKKIHADYPDIGIGIVDATAYWILTGEGYENVFQKLKSELRKNNENLAFIIVDTSTEASEGRKNPGLLEYPQLLALENYVQETIKVPFGIIIVSSEGGNTSDQVFYQRTMRFAREYKKLGGNPDFYILESWHKYPWTILPEDSTTSQPLTKVFLDISKTIKGTLIFPERSIEDTNADLTIDINDIKEVIKDYGKVTGLINQNNDVNSDGIVNIKDIIFIARKI